MEYRNDQIRNDQMSSSVETLDPEDKEIHRMFQHKSKLLSLIDNKFILNYKNLLLLIRNMCRSGQLPMHPTDYLCGNDLARNIYKLKYYLKDIEGNLVDKTPEDTFARLASFMAAMEKTEEKQQDWAIRFYKSLYEGYFLPGGRVLAGSGDLYRLKTLANCFVSLIEEDNIESIYKTAYECARTYSYGGGIGIDISCLRPKDSVVHNAADRSTGAVSFMEIYSLTTGLIGQAGRRGALMLTIDVKHPDILRFINIKQNSNWVTNQIVEQCRWSGKFDDAKLKEIERQVRENTQVRFANISIKVSDEFMQAVSEETTYGNNKILVYKKYSRTSLHQTLQGQYQHYSYAIPSKDIHNYELYQQFDTVEALQNYLQQKYNKQFSNNLLNGVENRDIFGDVVIPLENEECDLAIRYAGDFLLYFASKEAGAVKRLVKARQIWDQFVEGNYKTAEPGLIFWTQMTDYSPSNYVGRPISSTNPCGEVPLEDGGACNLGSINLSRIVKNGYTADAKIDWALLDQTTELLTRFLDNVVSWNEILNPLEKQRTAARETRRLGLGVMGIADMLNQLGIGYDSEEGISIIEQVAKRVANVAYRASAKLAEEKELSPIFNYELYSRGPFFNEILDDDTKEMVREKGLRNIAILSIAPTGTISNAILGFKNGNKNYIGVSGGIEPIFALYYTRRSESWGNKTFKIFHSTVQAYIDLKGFQDQAQNADSEDRLTYILPEYFFRTAHHLDPMKRVRIQGIFQRYVDHSISSTVNLSEAIEPETISNIYLKAWKHGLKGITIYRDGSRYPILSVDGNKNEFQEYKEKIFVVKNSEGNNIEATGDTVLKLPDGTLTTVYHAFKQNKLDKAFVGVKCNE